MGRKSSRHNLSHPSQPMEMAQNPPLEQRTHRGGEKPTPSIWSNKDKCKPINKRFSIWLGFQFCPPCSPGQHGETSAGWMIFCKQIAGNVRLGTCFGKGDVSRTCPLRDRKPLSSHEAASCAATPPTSMANLPSGAKNMRKCVCWDNESFVGAPKVGFHCISHPCPLSFSGLPKGDDQSHLDFSFSK